jgi:hypothetical protein
MTKFEMPRMEDLAAADAAPAANILTPEVRSGSSFSFSAAGSQNTDQPAFVVAWIYTVKEDDIAAFHAAVRAYETANQGPAVASGVSYRGSYAATISAIAPDFEYRTYWGLNELSELQKLNEYLHDPNNRANRPLLVAMLKLIARKPPMRAEILGLVRNAEPIGHSAPPIG